MNLPSNPFSWPIILVVAFLAIASGFLLSRLTPLSSSSKVSSQNSSQSLIPPDSIKKPEDVKVGQTYGNQSKFFKDIATGIIEKGNINGEGTHVLVRPGGPSQRASLISSVLDLDLFVGRKVEVRGETNASTKTSWLLDIGQIKVLE